MAAQQPMAQRWGRAGVTRRGVLTAAGSLAVTALSGTTLSGRPSARLAAGLPPSPHSPRAP
jgi:hypothetical protein